MPEDFDPYRKWLGIPPAEQPADHYRLLGVGRFEDDADTIDSAADRQMAHVRTFQAGPHSALSQQLLNEIAAARVCLLDSAKKAEYDARLRAKLAEYEARMQAKLAAQAAPPPAPASGMSPPPAVPVVAPAPSPSAPRPDEFTFSPSNKSTVARRRRRSNDSTLLLLGGAGVLIAIAILLMLARRDRKLHEVAEPRGADTPSIVKQPIGPVDRPSQTKDGLEDRPTDALTRPTAVAPPGPSDDAAGRPASPAASGLEIVVAQWGKDAQWQDMTERVRELVKDGRLLATAWADFFADVPDPAFGVQKQLRLQYRVGEELRSEEYVDGDFIYLDGRPAAAREPSSKGLEILEARYGAGAIWIDVLPRLSRWIHGDRLALRVSLVAMNHPAPDVPKALFLRYRTLDGEFASHAWDGEELILDARPVATAPEAVDLIAAADADRDSTGGKWRKVEQTLLAPDGESGSLPIAVPATNEYLLTAVISARPYPNNVNITFPIADRHVQLAIDGWPRHSLSGLQFVDGATGNQNETTRRGTFFERGQTTTVQCAVRKSSVYAKCNGRVVVDWRGDVQRLSLPDKPDANQRSVVVGGLGNVWRIERLEIAPLAAATPRTAPDSDEVVDLLKHIDPDIDAVHGEWQMTEEGLLSPSGESSRLQVPFYPPDDYELRVVAQRMSGKETLSIGLVADGRQTLMAIDGWGGNVGGFDLLDGKSADRNSTRYEGQVFDDERPKEIVCTVHPQSIRVTSDDKVLVDWHGDARRLSIARQWSVPDELGLALGSWDASFLISKFELRPLPPEKPSDLAATAQMNESASKNSTAGRPAGPSDADRRPERPPRDADSRLPVPAAKELMAAEKQVADTYDSQWKGAKTLAERLALARKMCDDGLQTAGNQVMRYALLREAQRHASGLGDAAIACEAIDQLSREFQIDARAEKLTACDDALKKAQSPKQLWTLVLLASTLSNGALAAEQYDEARKLVSLVALAGRRLRRTDLTKYAERRASLVRSRHDWHSRLEKSLARLKDAPDDPAANLSAGVALCLLQGDWQGGLPRLARSGEKRMEEIARLEAAAGQDASLRPALVDAWLAEAPNQSGAMRTEYELQAQYWLKRGLPDKGATDSAHKRALEKLAATPGMSLARVKPGLDMAMFNGADFEEFRARRIAAAVSHDFGFKSPHPSVRGDGFSIRWTGWLKPPLPGKYVIRTNSDDGCRLRINGNLLIDRWHRGAGEERAELELTDQLQPFSLEFNDTGVTASVRVAWALKDFSDFQPLPAEALYYDPENLAEK